MESGLAQGTFAAPRNNQANIAQLDDEDIDMIQSILDESEDEDINDEVLFVDENTEILRPIKTKPIRHNANQ